MTSAAVVAKEAGAAKARVSLCAVAAVSLESRNTLAVKLPIPEPRHQCLTSPRDLQMIPLVEEF